MGLSLPSAFRRSSETTGVAITAAGQVVWAHGLAGVPLLLVMELVCLTAELSYSIGDRVVVPVGAQESTVTSHGVSVVINATNVTLRFGSATSTFFLVDKTTGGVNAITNANWTVTVRAFR